MEGTFTAIYKSNNLTVLILVYLCLSFLVTEDFM